MIETCDTMDVIETLPPPTLEQMERHLIGLLRTIWKAQGKDKEIVDWDNRRETNKRGLTPDGRK